MAVDCKLNIIVLGDSGVGKTSLLLRFTTQTFKEYQTSTIIDCLHKVMHIEGKEVKLDLWDTAGQDRYRTLTKSYYRIADGVFLVYDVGNILSFSRLTSWLQELRELNENAVTVIVGNKTDNLNRRAVALQAVESYAKEEKLPFVETSAKNGENVNTIFESVIREILFRKGMISGSSELFNAHEKSKNASEEDFNRQIITESSDKDCNQRDIAKTPLTGADKTNIVHSLPPILNLPKDTVKLFVEKDERKKNKCC